MKLLRSISAVVVLCLFSTGSMAGSAGTSSFSMDPREFGLTNLLNTEPLVVPLLQASGGHKLKVAFGTNLFRIPTNFSLPFSGTNLIISIPGRERLVPGVYKAEPYTCIVVVPRAHADDRMVIGMLDKTESKMPMIEPKLKFVPWPE